MSEKRKISISNEVSSFIESLERTKKEIDQNQIAWSMHINRTISDYIKIVQSNLPPHFSQSTFTALKYICSPFINELYKFKYGDDLQQVIYSFYFELEKSVDIPEDIKKEILDIFMVSEITHIEAVSIVNFLLHS